MVCDHMCYSCPGTGQVLVFSLSFLVSWSLFCLGLHLFLVAINHLGEMLIGVVLFMRIIS